MELNVKKLQEGGAVAPGAGNEQAIQQAAQLAQQIIQQFGPEAAMMVAQAIVEMLQGGAAQEAPTEAPAPEEQAQFQRFGGKLVRIN